MNGAPAGIALPFSRSALLLVLIIGAALWACETPEHTAYGPPQGWVGTDGKWWRAGADTAGLFRDLDSFASMGLAERDVVFGAGRLTLEQQLVAAVRQRLLPLYRNQPSVVDSLFRRHVADRLAAGVDEERDPAQQIDRHVQDAYRILARHFREPRARSTIGEDIPLSARPDSLDALSGSVRMQVYVDEEGRTRTVQLLEGVHPVLDAIAMRALAQMEWAPAYLHGEPIPAWARFRLAFTSADPG